MKFLVRVLVLVVVVVVVTYENKVNPRFCLRLLLGFDKKILATNSSCLNLNKNVIRKKINLGKLPKTSLGGSLNLAGFGHKVLTKYQLEQK